LAGGGLLAAGLWLGRHLTAPGVRAWRPGAGERRRLGPLSVRIHGQGAPGIVLLHGLAASGDVFGAAYDVLAAAGTVVVPDLLGFGRSMDGGRADYGLDAHLDALDEVAQALALGGAPLLVAGHSLGGRLALHWAARHARQVTRTVAWGAPLYRDADEGARHLGRLGTMARLFALDTPRARRACAWMCAHRRAAGWLAVAMRPDLPVPVARHGVLHTWPAYRGAMAGVLLAGSFETALARLGEAAVPVLLAYGRLDRVGVPGRAEALARRHTHVRLVEHPGAGHDLPLTDAAWCVDLLRRPLLVPLHSAASRRAPLDRPLG
jgi:pimeloyl-ACP methyl ester carboxylesterase